MAEDNSTAHQNSFQDGEEWDQLDACVELLRGIYVWFEKPSPIQRAILPMFEKRDVITGSVWNRQTGCFAIASVQIADATKMSHSHDFISNMRLSQQTKNVDSMGQQFMG